MITLSGPGETELGLKTRFRILPATPANTHPHPNRPAILFISLLFLPRPDLSAPSWASPGFFALGERELKGSISLTFFEKKKLKCNMKISLNVLNGPGDKYARSLD
jgi:hypothetical protein